MSARGAGRVLLSVVRFYQRAVSPALPPRCRFYPTCSAYAVEAIETHGAARGGWLALRRILKCAPWHPGGVDLVPPAPGGTQGPVPASSTGAVVVSSSPADQPTPPARRATQEESSVV
jgi:uncharacterized protein